MSSEVAFILGGANTVFEDIQEAYKMVPNPHCVIAINDIGAEHPDVDHWVSMHPKKLPGWLSQRRANGFKDPKKFWTSLDRSCPEGMHFDKVRNTKGGSGLLAVYVGRKLGYTKMILCGVPLEQKNNHYFDERVWRECGIYRAVWENNPTLTEKDDVRSMSGWTKKRYGLPTEEWILS